jgi:hypothetical protein
MTHRRIARIVVAVLLAASPAAAHRSSSPQCFQDPPARNSEGPPEEDGYWEELVDIGMQGIHAIHLPTGKLLFWAYNVGGTAPGTIAGKLYDADTNVATDIELPHPAFCGGHTHLADGKIIIAGGQGRPATDSVVYDPFTNTFGPIIEMYAGRYYPTLTTLADGRVFCASGIGARSSTPEIFDPATSTWSPLGCTPGTTVCRNARLRNHFYTRTTQAPDERLFTIPASRANWAHTFDLDSELWTRHTIGTETSNGKMTPSPGVYYAPGKMLLAGGDFYGPATRATDAASIVEFADSLNPTLRAIAPMAYARNRGSLTLLADGTVLVTGGIRDAPCTGPASPFVYHPELWNPTTEQWETLGPMQEDRGYHSTALLLHDGSVIVAGGETRHETVQIFRPPYLFKGPRPVVTGIPAEIRLGESFDVFTPDAASVAQVNLLRLGAATHAYDENQRIVTLPFVAGAGKVTVDGPTSNYDAPPGYYMLFLISDLGVPSLPASGVSTYVPVRPFDWP